VFDWQGSDFWGSLDGKLDSSTWSPTRKVADWLKRDFFTDLYKLSDDKRYNSRLKREEAMSNTLDAANIYLYYAMADVLSWAIRKVRNLITAGTTRDDKAEYERLARNFTLSSRDEQAFMKMYFEALTRKLESSKLLKDNADLAQTELELTQQALKKMLDDNALAKEDYSSFLQQLYDSLKSNKVLYENIINDTNNDRSWATELDGVQPYSPLTGLTDTSLDVQMRDVQLEGVTPGEQDMAELIDTSLNLKLNDVQLEGTEIPEQELVHLIDTTLDLALKDVSLEGTEIPEQQLAELLSEALALKLKDVQLEGTEIPEQQLARLLETELVLKLKDVTLEGVEIPEQELVHLIDTAIDLKMKEIDLEGTEVPDQQLAELVINEVVNKLNGVELEGTALPEQQLSELVENAVSKKLTDPGVEGTHLPKQQSAELVAPTAPEQEFATLASNVVAKKMVEQVLASPEVNEAMRDAKLSAPEAGTTMKDVKLADPEPQKEMLMARIEESGQKLASIKEAMIESPDKVTFMKMTELADDLMKSNVELQQAIEDAKHEAKMRDVELESVDDRSTATSLDGGPDKSKISSGAIQHELSHTKQLKKIKSGGLLPSDYTRKTEIL